MVDPARPPSLRSLAVPIYTPTFLFAVGQGAVIPIVALAARDLGASIPVAGLIVALRGIGTLAFDIPAGSLVGRLGERTAMTLATALLAVSLVGCALTDSIPLFAACMFLMGCGWSVWLLARLAYVTEVMPVDLRGRALSTLGGIMRIGNFVGPLAGAALVAKWGVDATYVVHFVLVIAGCAVLLSVPEPAAVATFEAHGPVRFRAIARDHSRTFATAGLGAMSLSVMRASRQAVLPLWADSIGLDASTVGILFGLSAAMDMTLFYPAGSVSDRWGRKVVAVPCLTLLAISFVLLPLTDSFVTLAAVGVLMGLGNGMGSGIVMTLGADFSPAAGRAEFLGVWRTVSDVGTAGGPLVAAGVAALAGLGPASLAVGALGGLGAVVIATRMPEPLVRPAARARDAMTAGRVVETNKARLEFSPDGLSVTKSPYVFWNDEILGQGRRIFRNEQRVTRMISIDRPPVTVPRFVESRRRSLTTEAIDGTVLGPKFPDLLQRRDVDDTITLVRDLEAYRPRRRWLRRYDLLRRLWIHQRARVINGHEHDLIVGALPRKAPLRFAHGDVTARNLIRRHIDHALVLIDWEWAGLYPPAFDLAFFWFSLVDAGDGRARVEESLGSDLERRWFTICALMVQLQHLHMWQAMGFEARAAQFATRADLMRRISDLGPAR